MVNQEVGPDALQACLQIEDRFLEELCAQDAAFPWAILACAEMPRVKAVDGNNLPGQRSVCK
jgi:hypothetical protein